MTMSTLPSPLQSLQDLTIAIGNLQDAHDDHMSARKRQAKLISALLTSIMETGVADQVITPKIQEMIKQGF